MFFRRALMNVGGLVLVIAVIGIYDRFNMSANYMAVAAEVTNVTKDCYIKGYRQKIVERGSNRIAYMDCELAPDVAEQFHMSKNDIYVRYRIDYTYQSPIDGAWYDGNFTDTESYTSIQEAEEDPWYEGRVFKVYMHKKNPKKTRVRKSDLELEPESS